MSVTLAHNTHGTHAIRLVKVGRRADRDDLKDVTIAVGLEGDFGPAYTDGDTSRGMSMDAIRAAVYALAAQHPVEPIESFGAILGRHCLEHCAAASQARVEIAERPWTRLVVHERPHPHAFALDKSEIRTAAVTTTREFAFVEAGVDGLSIIKSLHAAPAGEVDGHAVAAGMPGDRLLTTELRAIWLYADSDLAFDGCWRGIRQLLLDVFAEHHGDSLQQTLYAMGSAALEMFEEILEIRLAMPDNAYLPAEGAAAGPRHGIYVPADEPYGLIEATVRRR